MALWNSKDIKSLCLSMAVEVYDKLGKLITKALIENADPDQLIFMEGGAYDLRVDKVYCLNQDIPAVIPAKADNRITPPIYPISPSTYDELGEEKGWCIKKGEIYLLETMESVNTPLSALLRFDPRTTLFRCGSDLKTGVARPNYQGTLTFMYRNLRTAPLYLAHSARVSSLLVEGFILPETDIYNGPWQGGIVSTNGQKVRAY